MTRTVLPGRRVDLKTSLSSGIEAILEKETGPMGKFILKKQCDLIGVPHDHIEACHLPKLSLQLSEALLFFGKEKANRVLAEVKGMGKDGGGNTEQKLERELDLAQAAGNVGNVKEEEDHLSRAEKLGASEHRILSPRFHCLRGSLHLREGKLAESEEEYRKARELFLENEDVQGASEAEHGLGSTAWRMGKYDNAKKHILDCVEKCQKRGDKRMEGKCFMALGNIHDEWGKFEDAVVYSEKSKKALEEAGDEKGLATLHNNLGVAYARRNMYKESLVEYEKCISLAEKIGYVMMQGWSMFNAAEDNARLGEYGKAIELCKKSEAVFNELGDRIGASGVQMSYAVTYWLQGNNEVADEHFKRTLDLRRELGMPYRLADALYEYGCFLGDAGRPEEARAVFRESLDIFKKLNNQERIHQLEIAADTLTKKGEGLL